MIDRNIDTVSMNKNKPTAKVVGFDAPVSVRDYWNRCVYCGKFIAYEEFANGKADNVMILPDSALSYETWEAYHLDCKAH